MSNLTPTYGRLLGALSTVALIVIAAVGLFTRANDQDEATTATAAVVVAEPVAQPRVAATVPLASVEIGSEATGPNLDPFTAEAVLGAYTNLTPDEWVKGVLAGFRPDPAPAPPVSTVVEAPPASAAPTPSPEPVASAATQAAASPSAAKVSAAPFDGVIVSEDVGPAPVPETTEPAVAPEAPLPATQTAGWVALRNCESHNNYQINTGNGFYGAYQFTTSTWNAVAQIADPAYVGVRPDLAPPAAQDRMAYALRYEIAWGGWHHWPICGKYIA